MLDFSFIQYSMFELKSIYVSLKTAVANKCLNETTDVISDIEWVSVHHSEHRDSSTTFVTNSFDSNFTTCTLTSI